MKTLLKANGPSTSPNAERHLFLFIAIWMLIAVIIGFGPSFLLRPFMGTPPGLLPMTPMVLLHGMLFMLWVGLFVMQATLIHTGRTRLHRQAGRFGALLIPALLVVGYIASIGGALRGAGPPGNEPFGFLAVPLFALFAFTGLSGAALVYRRHPQTHKRLMVAGMCAMMGAAYSRMPPFGGPVGIVLLPALPVFVLGIWDIIKNGRPHVATVAGGVTVLLTSTVSLVIGPSDFWQAIAHWLVQG